MRLKFFFAFIFLFPAMVAMGQNSQDQFGKSRIQYKSLSWQYISTINFDIYYSEGGKELAANVAGYAETDFARITEMLGFSPYSKIKIILYNSVSDMRQSNIALEDPNYMAGGQTNFVKSKLEIAFQGTQVQLKKDISFGIAHLMINTMMYGGSLREIVQSSYLLSLPEWFINGAAAYIAEGWSIEMDNFMRDAFLNRHLHKPEAFAGEQGTLAGQSIWNYIVQKYGMQNMTSVLHLTQTFRNEESGIESAFGISYHLFTREWREYYTGMGQEVLLSYKMPSKEFRFGKNKSRDFDYQNLLISPDGRFLSYSRNFKGKYAVILNDLERDKNRKIFKAGYKVVNQKVDPNLPLAAWQDTNIFSVLVHRKDKIYLRVYDLQKKERKKIMLKEIRQVFSYDISRDGSRMVFSGGEKGQSDIFIYDLGSNSITRLTNDLFDDLDPEFIGSNGVIFSSNRKESIPEAEFGYKDISDVFHIYSMDVSGNNLRKITRSGNNTSPCVLDGNHFSYLNTDNGISTLFSSDISGHQKAQLSSFALNMEEYDLNAGMNRIVFSMIYKGRERIFYNPVFSPENIMGSSLTARQRKMLEQNPSLAEDTAVLNDTLGIQDIDINNYKFESDRKKSPENKQGDKDKFTPTGLKSDINMKGPYSYKNLFSADRFVSTLMIDPLKGMGVLGEVSMSDMFGNHRMTAGIFGLVDLKSSNLYGEYLYLRKRVDIKLRFDRETFFATNASASQRYTLNRFTAGFSVPLSVTDRISVFPMVVSTRFTDHDTLVSLYDASVFYGGVRAEYVFDNTIVHGLNLIQGTRSKISIEQFNDPSDKTRNFGKYSFDIRHYQRVHRELTFASRISFGGFFGNAKKNFLLGGMDNWLFNTSSHTGHKEPLAVEKHFDNSDLLFVRYITNLRGFNYNTQFGSRFFLFNAELRFPIVRYFHKGTIKSNFLKNLQFIGFTDAGSAWSGVSPFKKTNSVNTQTVNAPPFSATVVNYINPFLIGYGIGVRTLFLGYYMKLDMGWGLVNGYVQKPKVYLTFGYDF